MASDINCIPYLNDFLTEADASFMAVIKLLAELSLAGLSACPAGREAVWRQGWDRRLEAGLG